MKPGFVYIARAGDALKIGFSATVKKRMTALAASCPIPIELLHTFFGNDARAVEFALHIAMAEYRRNGEWFDEKCLPQALDFLMKRGLEEGDWESPKYKSEIMPEPLPIGKTRSLRVREEIHRGLQQYRASQTPIPTIMAVADLALSEFLNNRLLKASR